MACLILAIALAVSVLAIDPTAAAAGAAPDPQSKQEGSASPTASSQDQPSTDSKTDTGSKAAKAASKDAQVPQQDKPDADKQENAAKNDDKHETSKSASGPSGDSKKKEPELVTIPADTVISIRMTEPIDVKESKPGQEYTASINEPVLANNQVVIPRGTAARIRLLHSKKAGHIRGRADVVVELVGVILHNKNYPIRSSIMEKKGAGIGSKMKNGAKEGAQGAASVAVDAVTSPALAPIEAVPAAVSPATAMLSAQQLKLDGTRIDFVLRAPIDLPLPDS